MTSPFSLGLPSKFSEWRPGQRQAINDILAAKERFFAQIAPTGIGKSLIYMAASRLVEGRVCILTSTKPLMGQLIKDFSSIGLVEIKGRNNYPCLQDSYLAPDDSICSLLSCEYKTECPYKEAIVAARSSDLVVTNYHFWMTAKEALGGFSWLIMDEAHLSTHSIEDHLTVVVDLKLFSAILRVNVERKKNWTHWLASYMPIVNNKIDKCSRNKDLKGLHQLLPLLRVCQKLLRMAPYPHITEDLPKGLIKVSPSFTRHHKDLLISDIPHILFTSATFHPKTAKQLGVSTLVKEYPSTFSIEQRPIYIVPAPMMSYNLSSYDTIQWARLLDSIIEKRLDRKGIIHLSSYAWCRRYLETSRFGKLFWTHDKNETEMVVSAFKRASAPAVLVSPSIGTGWDFPYSDCHYQIIGKIPFPNFRDPIIMARKSEDEEYPIYLAIQQIQQMSGRGMRAGDDYCETFICDGHIDRLLNDYPHLFQKWFLEAVKPASLKAMPEPLEKKYLL